MFDSIEEEKEEAEEKKEEEKPSRLSILTEKRDRIFADRLVPVDVDWKLMHDAEETTKLAETKYKNIDLHLGGLERKKEKLLAEGHVAYDDFKAKKGAYEKQKKKI